jgi:FkbM family methyltransferase
MKKIISKLVRKFGYEISQIEPKNFQKIELFEDRYEISFSKITIETSSYFIPKYAMHRPAVKDICKGKLFEPKTHELVQALCKQKPGSIVHAGTFFGDMLPNFSKFVNGSVYAFEPVLENFILAKLSVDVNELFNVILINSALSANISNLRINTSQQDNLHAGGASSISEHGKICAALKIDCLNASDIILIQLDVEGHELEALLGAIKTIERCRPVIAIEDNNNSCESFLLTNNYLMARKIPGLEVWAPKEDSNVIKIIKSF